MGDPAVRLLDLDARHGELLDRLAALDQRINEVLDDWSRSKEALLVEQQKRNLLFNKEITISDTENSEVEATEPETA